MKLTKSKVIYVYDAVINDIFKLSIVYPDEIQWKNNGYFSRKQY